MAYSSSEYKSGNIFTLAAFLIGLYIIVAEFAIVQGTLMAGGAFLISPTVRVHLISVPKRIPYVMLGLSLLMATVREFYV
ncbi:hypothetical protein OB920_05210 [Halobacteria archaeon HArc-gm2]|nr:hypothetical protein [Halobacteria archaeon HArc-gm2]